jgi:hypothetical protein
MFRVLFHKSNGTLDGYFREINEDKLSSVLSALPKTWIAVVYDAETNEIKFSYTSK